MRVWIQCLTSAAPVPSASTCCPQVKAYIADLCECLADKSPMVEALEDSLAELREDRAAAARERAQALEREIMRPAEAAVSAALAVLARGGAAEAATAAAEAAAAEAAASLMGDDDGPPELDEFGRNVNIEREREAKERGRRRLRVVASEARQAEAVARAEDAVRVDQQDETEGEDEAELRRYSSRHDEIMQTAATIFLDAGEEYASIGAVKEQLEDFKLRCGRGHTRTRAHHLPGMVQVLNNGFPFRPLFSDPLPSSYPKEYSNTYMHLSTPALFAPYVRLELLR